jgi:tRNA-splicing ligase RtcB
MRRQANLPDRDLACFEEGSRHFEDYVRAVGWAQRYAAVNRELMMREVVEAARTVIATPFRTHVEAVNCHHNYVHKECHFGQEVYVTRKGAVIARAGQWGIIPGSMGARSYIVRGKGRDVLDETPAAYKDIDAVMAAQGDLVEVVHTLKQVVCVKG